MRLLLKALTETLCYSEGFEVFYDDNITCFLFNFTELLFSLYDFYGSGGANIENYYMHIYRAGWFRAKN